MLGPIDVVVAPKAVSITERLRRRLGSHLLPSNPSYAPCAADHRQRNPGDGGQLAAQTDFLESPGDGIDGRDESAK